MLCWRAGGYAEYAIAHEGSVLPVPDGFSLTEAAAIPEVFATAWLNLFMEANLSPGERVILHAGASGVGTAAIQLCKAFDNPVFVTLGSEEKLQRCIELGAAAGSNRHEGSFVEGAEKFAEGQGIDVILDPVGGAYLKDNLGLMAMDGRLVLIGLMGGATSEIELPRILANRLRVIGSTLRARPVEEKARIMTSMEEQVWPLMESGRIHAVIDTVMPIQHAEEAHTLLTSDNTFGKVVLSI